MPFADLFNHAPAQGPEPPLAGRCTGCMPTADCIIAHADPGLLQRALRQVRHQICQQKAGALGAGTKPGRCTSLRLVQGEALSALAAATVLVPGWLTD